MAAFQRFENMATKQEGALRDLAERASNMTGYMSNLSQQTMAPANINPSEIPAVASLANLKASVDQSSQLRQKEATRLTKQLPKYVTSYRNYLKWRYPNVYGGGKSKSTSLSPVTGSMLPDSLIPPLPSIGPTPTFNPEG